MADGDHLLARREAELLSGDCGFVHQPALDDVESCHPLVVLACSGRVVFGGAGAGRRSRRLGGCPGGERNRDRRGISPELLEILANPADKGPVELHTDGSGKEWLINRRNGFRYPVEDGIPIMLIEEGEKNKDESLIAS